MFIVWSHCRLYTTSFYSNGCKSIHIDRRLTNCCSYDCNNHFKRCFHNCQPDRAFTADLTDTFNIEITSKQIEYQNIRKIFSYGHTSRIQSNGGVNSWKRSLTTAANDCIRLNRSQRRYISTECDNSSNESQQPVGSIHDVIASGFVHDIDIDNIRNFSVIAHIYRK